MAEEPTEFELSDATHVRVLETNLLHASDVIYWLDGASASNIVDMTRIQHSLELTLTKKPAALKSISTIGKTAFWSTPTTPMVSGTTTDTQRQKPATQDFVVAGSIVDNRGRFNPAAFEFTLGGGNGQTVVLFPAPAGVRVPAGGALQGRVVFANNSMPLIWGLLNLTVTIGLAETLSFQGQTDAKGDFIIALTRLPPLPLSATEYNADLTIKGLASANARQPVKLVDLLALKLESTTVPADFVTTIPLVIRPGEIKRINSVNKSSIAVQTA